MTSRENSGKIEPFQWSIKERTRVTGVTTLHIPCDTATVDFELNVVLRLIRGGRWKTSISDLNRTAFEKSYKDSWGGLSERSESAAANLNRFDMAANFWIPRLNLLNTLPPNLSLSAAKRTVRAKLVKIMKEWEAEQVKRVKPRIRRIGVVNERGESRRPLGGMMLYVSTAPGGRDTRREYIFPRGLLSLTAHAEPGTVRTDHREAMSDYLLGSTSWYRVGTGQWQQGLDVPIVINYNDIIEARRITTAPASEVVAVVNDELTYVSQSANLVGTPTPTPVSWADVENYNAQRRSTTN